MQQEILKTRERVEVWVGDWIYSLEGSSKFVDELSDSLENTVRVSKVIKSLEDRDGDRDLYDSNGVEVQME